MANEKLITTAALIAKFEEALKEKWGYIWGTAGEMWTAAKQENLEKTTDADRANSRKYGSKWIGHKVADCSGLFSLAFKQLGGYMYHGSDTMFRKYCTVSGQLKNGKRTDGQELKPGTAVFTYNSATKKRGHVGLYIGGGYVIEARGAYYGVVKTKLTSRPCVEWGELKGVDYGNDVKDTVPVTDPTPGRWTLRKGNKGAAVKELQQMLSERGYSLGSYGIDGDFGKATEAAVRQFQKDNGLTVDGIVGDQTWKALESKPIIPEKYTVSIPGLTLVQANSIAIVYPEAIITKE